MSRARNAYNVSCLRERLPYSLSQTRKRQTETAHRMAYALRTDKCFDAVKDWVVAQNFTGYSVRETVEGEGNEHWHWILVTDKRISQVRTSFNRAVPECKGNASYSLSLVKDVEKYKRYMAKGDHEGVLPEIAWSHGLDWTSEEFERLHEAYWEENRKLKKRKTGSVTDHVVDLCKAQNVRWDDRLKIGDLYIRELVERHKSINLFSAKSAINLIQILLCPNDDAFNEMSSRLLVA